MRQAVERVEQGLDEAQNDIAAKMTALATEMRWARLLHYPKTAGLLDMLAAEGDAGDEMGLT